MFVLNETKKDFYRWLLGGRLRWAMCCTVIYGMSYVLPIDGYCISRLFTYAWDEACAPHLFTHDGLYVGDEHVFLGYLPKMSYVLSIDRSNISWLFTQMRHMYMTSYVFQCYFPGWAMCSLSMGRISRSYLTRMSRMYEMSHVFRSYLPRMSYVLPIDVSYISWLFTQAQPYVCDEPYVPWLFTQDELCAPDPWVVCLTVIYLGWAMCSLLMDVVSHGYLPMISHMYETSHAFHSYLSWKSYVILMVLVSHGYLPNMSYVLHMDVSTSPWLFTQILSCVLHMDGSRSPQIFTSIWAMCSI
jgi:hypothetical protein